MNRFKYLIGFIKAQRIYIWMLLFIITFNIIMLIAPHKEKPQKEGLKTYQIQERLQRKFDDIKERQDLLNKNPQIVVSVGLVSLSLMAIFLLGVIFLVRFILLKRHGREPIMPNLEHRKSVWNIWDICKIVILFLFYGYLLVFVEALVFEILGIKVRNDTLMAAFNTAVMDVAVIFFICFFVIKRYKENLLSIGIYFKDFVKDILLGIVSYVSFFPIFIASLILVIFVVNITGFKPPPQPVVELFVKVDNPKILMYLTIFVTIVGPIAEEIFFRGFAYNAIKKAFGVKLSLAITAIAFAVLHTDLVGLLPITCLGFLLGYVYEKRGSLIPSITIHMIHNTLTVFALFLFKEVARLVG